MNKQFFSLLLLVSLSPISMFATIGQYRTIAPVTSLVSVAPVVEATPLVEVASEVAAPLVEVAPNAAFNKLAAELVERTGNIADAIDARNASLAAELVERTQNVADVVKANEVINDQIISDYKLSVEGAQEAFNKTFKGKAYNALAAAGTKLKKNQYKIGKSLTVLGAATLSAHIASKYVDTKTKTNKAVVAGIGLGSGTATYFGFDPVVNYVQSKAIPFAKPYVTSVSDSVTKFVTSSALPFVQKHKLGLGVTAAVAGLSLGAYFLNKKFGFVSMNDQPELTSEQLIAGFEKARMDLFTAQTTLTNVQCNGIPAEMLKTVQDNVVRCEAVFKKHAQLALDRAKKLTDEAQARLKS